MPWQERDQKLSNKRRRIAKHGRSLSAILWAILNRSKRKESQPSSS